MTDTTPPVEPVSSARTVKRTAELVEMEWVGLRGSVADNDDNERRSNVSEVGAMNAMARVGRWTTRRWDCAVRVGGVNV